MLKIITLKIKSEEEAYEYFDKNIRKLTRKSDGKIDRYAPGLVDNDIDAFRHSYASGRYTQEYNEFYSKCVRN